MMYLERQVLTYAIPGLMCLVFVFGFQIGKPEQAVYKKSNARLGEALLKLPVYRRYPVAFMV